MITIYRLISKPSGDVNLKLLIRECHRSAHLAPDVDASEAAKPGENLHLGGLLRLELAPSERVLALLEVEGPPDRAQALVSQSATD